MEARHRAGGIYLFRSSNSSPDNPHSARDDSDPVHGNHFSAGVFDRNQDRLSAWFFCEFGSAVAAISQRPRRQCQVLMRWKLQAMEGCSARSCRSAAAAAHKMLPFRRAGEHLVPQTRPGLRIMGGPSRPRDTMLSLSCLKIQKYYKSQSFLDSWC